MEQINQRKIKIIDNVYIMKLLKSEISDDNVNREDVQVYITG